jgi:tRNA-binding protein
LATADELLSLDVRVGTIVSAARLRGARTPAFALEIDLGALGTRTGFAQITDLYESTELTGLQVVAIVNLPRQRVAGLDADVVVLTVDDGKGEHVLLMPERPVPDGGKVG